MVKENSREIKNILFACTRRNSVDYSRYRLIEPQSQVQYVGICYSETHLFALLILRFIRRLTLNTRLCVIFIFAKVIYDFIRLLYCNICMYIYEYINISPEKSPSASQTVPATRRVRIYYCRHSFFSESTHQRTHYVVRFEW